MGNCQAVDAAALVIQHPSGKVDRMYWAISASEVMKMYPGHYVSLIIPLPPTATTAAGEENPDNKTVRFTRVKLLRSSDTLVLGRAYRLVASQEVMKVLRAKRYAKMKKNQTESEDMLHNKQSSSCQVEEEARGSDLDKTSQETRHERNRQRSGSANIGATRSKSWRPSLQSISEAGS